jgi:GT2 family glycosyltransferase
MTKPIVSVILGSYNRLKLLKLTIDSIRKEIKNLDTEIIVIDGGSTDGSLQWLKKQKDIITILQHNRGKWKGRIIERKSWGFFMNLGFKAACGKYICMLSDDCLIVPNALTNGINFFEEKLAHGEKIGAVAFYWRDWPIIDDYVVSFDFDKLYVNHGLYLKEALEDIGYIDEDNFFFYCADSDICLKMMHKGWQVLEAPDSYIEHYAHATVNIKKGNGEQVEKDVANLIKKWSGIYFFGEDKDANHDATHYTKSKKYQDKTKTVRQFQKLIFRDVGLASEHLKISICRVNYKQLAKNFFSRVLSKIG